jgi:predicted small metal-binding protein
MRDEKLRDQAPARINPSVQPTRNGQTPSTSTPGAKPISGMADERREQESRNASDVASPNARGAGDVRFTSYPQNEAAQNPAAWESAHGDRSLRCGDAVGNDCGWSVSGKTEEEVLGYMRAHVRQAHGKNEFTSAELESARRAIHTRAA